MTEEISRLQSNLDHEAVVHLHRKEELKQLSGEQKELKKGSEVLRKDFELQQKELVWQMIQRELEEMRQRAEGPRPP